MINRCQIRIRISGRETNHFFYFTVTKNNHFENFLALKSQNSTTSAICNGFEHMGIRELEHHQSLERIQEGPEHEHVREHHENCSTNHQSVPEHQSQGQSQSEFNLLYERLFDKIQNQEINSQDWSNLEHEYRIWVEQMDQNTKSLQDKLKSLKNEKETLSKAKTVLDKVRVESSARKISKNLETIICCRIL